ncbi:MAG: pyruvate kinase [Ardenticatenaceae bacterium]|nr:pyruvate kinase [Ardenticatenaceae bacterium]HBY97873.1 pyruvate kinase [Chloroflexota bacterium]
MRRTQIVATIGPASWKSATLREMIAAGMDVARLNMSHGDHETHERTIDLTRKAAAEADQPVAIVADLQGAKVRIGEIPGGMELPRGATVKLAGGTPRSGEVPVPGVALGEAVQPGDRLLLDDGKIELRALKVDARTGRVTCEVVLGGRLTSHKGLTLPNAAGAANHGLSTKDFNDLVFAVQSGVDWVALSYLRAPDEVRLAREIVARLMRELAPAGAVSPRLMAKIETPQAVACLDGIIAASDGVMVARGDLGLEMDPEDVPLVQKMIIRKCNRAGVPVVTATEMLESMTASPRPTRAEVSDVCNAILDGTDAVMLSGESATGLYPVESVRQMRRIIERVEAEERRPVFTSPDLARHLWRSGRRWLEGWPYHVPVSPRLAPVEQPAS